MAEFACPSGVRRIPVAQVQVKINNVWVKMQRANNNQWPYYNTNGPWQTGFPMPIRISSIAGEVGDPA